VCRGGTGRKELAFIWDGTIDGGVEENGKARLEARNRAWASPAPPFGELHRLVLAAISAQQTTAFFSIQLLRLRRRQRQRQR